MLSITAFGGPQVHFVRFLEKFCDQRGLLTKVELIELYSFCQVLPGPTSTQTITAVGLKLGGHKLAILTLVIWIIPASLLMSIIVIGYSQLKNSDLLNYFSLVPAMAVGFLFAAAIKMFPLIKKHYGFYLITLGACLALVSSQLFSKNTSLTSIVLPIILFLSAFISQKFINIKYTPNNKPLGKLNLKQLFLIATIFFSFVFVGNVFDIKEVLMFENTFRLGSLVFGGGQVLIPLMESQFVHAKHYLTSVEFAHGYGFIQALPGPVFSFSTFVNGMALQEKGVWFQLLGCLIGTVAIFLPGLLIMFFAYPIWGRIKTYPFVQRSLDGIVAGAVGLIFAAGILLSFGLIESISHKTNYFGEIFVLIGTILLIQFTKLPSPFIVLLTILASFLF